MGRGRSGLALTNRSQERQIGGDIRAQQCLYVHSNHHNNAHCLLAKRQKHTLILVSLATPRSYISCCATKGVMHTLSE